VVGSDAPHILISNQLSILNEDDGNNGDGKHICVYYWMDPSYTLLQDIIDKEHQLHKMDQGLIVIH
jgi:hypothetical protein